MSEGFALLNEGTLQIDDIHPKQSQTDPIIQLKKRLNEIETEWLRVMNTPIAYHHTDKNKYVLARHEKRVMIAKIQHKITQNVFAIRILERVNNGSLIVPTKKYRKIKNQ
jgi:hypothetical protein